nr:hypothetical protein [Kiritimatiellia bacterium]
MKKLLATIAAAVGIASSAFAATWTDPSTGIEWTYTVSGNEATLYNGDDTSISPRLASGVIAVPSSIKGKTVTAIGGFAFYQCYN